MEPPPTQEIPQISSLAVCRWGTLVPESTLRAQGPPSPRRPLDPASLTAAQIVPNTAKS